MHAQHNVLHVLVPVSREIADLYLRNGRVMPVEVFPEQLRAALGVDEPDPRERFSELDRLIASVVDEHGPVNAGEIARIIEDEHDHITTDKGVRDRFGNSMPLKLAGYRSTRSGYTSPDAASPSQSDT